MIDFRLILPFCGMTTVFGWVGFYCCYLYGLPNNAGVQATCFLTGAVGALIIMVLRERQNKRDIAAMLAMRGHLAQVSQALTVASDNLQAQMEEKPVVQTTVQDAGNIGPGDGSIRAMSLE